MTKKIAFKILTIVLLTSSCNTMYKLTHRRYGLPQEFHDTLDMIDSNKSEFKGDYIIYSSISGNCFGPSYTGVIKVFQCTNDTCFKRTVWKPINKKKLIETVSITDIEKLKQEFLTQRLDTVQTLPEGHISITPPTIDKIEVKFGNITWSTEFEQTPILSSTDSTHILFEFINEIVKN